MGIVIINLFLLNKLIYFVCSYLVLYLRIAKDQNIRFLYIIVILFCIFNLYLRNETKLDILTYRDAIDKGNYNLVFEPGFALIIDFVSFFLSDGTYIIFVVQIILAFCFLVVFGLIIQNCSTVNSVDRLLFTIISVAFILGVNNNLRQCFSILPVILALDTMSAKKSIALDTIKFVALTALATLLHRSAIAFCLYFYVFLIFDRFLPASLILKSVFILLGNIVITIFLSEILLFTAFTAYEGVVLTGGGRVDVLVKLSAYLILISVLTLVFRTSFVDCKLSVINSLRFSFAVLSLLIYLMSGAGELASRILYFCFVLDIYIICLLLINKRLTTAVVSGSTGVFALNSVNILVF